MSVNKASECKAMTLQ